ncbi:CYFA0S02e06260g1_1 [Cyberlindnera fabianii]|uniref:CYFA0S02e06260g1_1 n=1 Tax=Cyberlindnera fabianii TaxID=36022 RepID=A0A061AVR1_CYBFA|nr:Oligopeptide transporter 2 [Cyberlindnera fabianii]CDR38816.1 CYFA0S02e06260g1_1 [Cyberlindnera fabianii]
MVSEKDPEVKITASRDEETSSKEGYSKDTKNVVSDDVVSFTTDTGEDFGVAKWDEEAVRAYYHTLPPDYVDILLEKTGHGATLDEKDHLTPDLLYLLDKLTSMSDARALEIMQETVDDHVEDTNFPADDWAFFNSVLNGELDFENDPKINFKGRLLAVLAYYHSPYPEIRSVTDVYNNPDDYVETIRSYTIAIIWVIVASGVNEFFSHRQPSIKLYTSVISILMYPCGKAWEYIMPKVNVPWFGGKRIPLNPGPYTYKEQMFASLLTAVSGNSVYVSYNIVTQKMFYKQDWVNFGYQITLALSTQCLGLAFAGIMRKFVIYPTRAMWPTMLPTLALNRALLKSERKELIHGWKISKYNFFWIAFVGMFLYFWIPDYLFQALSTFNWMNWIAPNNFNLAMVTGTNSGLGLNPWSTFDWNIISFAFKPLATPINTVLNMYAGCIIGFFCIIGVYYSNHKWTGYLPINSNAIFTNTGESYQVTEILTDGLMDFEKYQAYSPPYYSAANLVVYGAFFLVYPLTFIYNSFKEWRTISAAFKMMHANALETFHEFTFKRLLTTEGDDYSKFNDAHSKMMRKYKEVPDWYYLVILVLSFVLAIICVEVYKETKTPVWGLFFVVAINFVFLIPFSVLFAVTGAQLGLNVLVELIVGYALQGNGNALMTLKAYGYNIDGQADNFLSSLKIGHYAKLPPRAVFRAQIIGVLIQVFVVLGVINWSVANIEDFCEVTQSQKFTCPGERTYYSASVFWGVIGPKIVFSGIYPQMQYCFLIGFLVALLFIGIKLVFGKKSWYPTFTLFEPTVFIVGILNIYAPYNLAYITPGIYCALVFMWYIRKRYLAWFEKYNYVLSAGLDAGVAFSAIIIFFAVQYHAKNINWWGNTVSYGGIEGGEGQQTLLDITETVRGYFGPEKGSYPMP